MEGNRIRGERARGRMLASTLLVAVAMLLCSAPAAGAATQVRTLFLSEQVRPTAVRGPLSGPVQPHQMVAQPGEEEGFLLAFRPDQQVFAEAVLDGSSASFTRTWTQLLRTEWVNVMRPSTGTGAAPGRYADPLPPQALRAGNAGRLLARAGEWSAFTVLVSVPATAPAGTQSGTVLVRSSTGTVLASVPFSITVVQTKAKTGAADPAIAPRDPRNFKLLLNFNPTWYRNLAPAASEQDQYEQAYRTMWMLARHRAGTNVWTRAYPTADGRYSCSAAGGYLDVYDQMPWWADGKPGALPVKLMPNHAVARCGQGSFAVRAGTAAITSSWFIYRVAEHWRSSGVQDHRTYFLNPYDEPTLDEQRTSVPQVNRMVHDYAPGVRVLGTAWPMATASGSTCRTVKGRRTCARRSGQPGSNLQLRDGANRDDLDGWVVPYFRSFGFSTSPQQRAVGISRAREVSNRLASIRAKGGESWAYDLPVGTRRIPQTAIDGPSTDARLLLWPLAREGASGWFTAVSNRWVDPQRTTTPRNPWDNPLSWVGSKAGTGTKGTHGVISNGWGSLYYPGLRPQLGLADPLAQPVSSLRMERLRDGVEDANLMRQYRDRFGQSALNAATAKVLGQLVSGTDLPGNETFPKYSTAGLALRMELARRQMIARLAE